VKLNPTAIPQGTRTYIFEEASVKRSLEQTIHSSFRSRGFQEIVTPPFEYHESAIIGLSEEERNRIIRFTEGDSGRIIALRADITSQVARSTATHLLDRPLPLRLCYTGSVFRRARKGKGEQFVLNQSGVEIVGFAGEEADMEIVESIVSALDSIGLEDFSISLGHAGFTASFLKGINGADCEKIKRAVSKKDKGTLRGILHDSKIEEERMEALLTLPDLYGGAEVFEKAQKILFDENSENALKNLKTIFDVLEKKGLEGKVSLDLGEMRGFGYYTGMNVELFSGAGIPIGTGGRYDNLVKRFGPDLPAVGFGFDIDKLMEAIRNESDSPLWHGADILLSGDSGDTAKTLRQAGLMVLTPLDDAGELLEFAQKMSIPNLLEVTENKDKYLWTAIASKESREVTIAEFIKTYFGRSA